MAGPNVYVPERLNASVALSVTPAVPSIEPVMPPAPICSVPPLIVVAPVYAAEPARINVPAPPTESVLPGTHSPIEPEIVSLVPAEPLKLKLSARSSGALMASLPLVTLSGTALPPLSSVRMPPVPAVIA